MQLAPMLTLSDVSRRGWHTCAEAEQTPLMYLPYTYANAERYQQLTSPFFQLLLSPEAAAIAPVYERTLANCV